MSTSTQVEDKMEYDESMDDLEKFVTLPQITKVLSKECINAILDLAGSLRSKEHKLAGYLRQDIKDCLDACTTSPVESNNNAIKHGPNFVNSKMNLDKTVLRLLTGIQERLRKRLDEAEMELHKTNYSSRCPMKVSVCHYLFGRF